MCAEVGPAENETELLRRLEQLDPSRCAYYATYRADALIALNGIGKFLESSGQALIDRTIDAYELLGAKAHARRIRDGQNNAGIRNPTGDSSDARLPFAISHWQSFFVA